MPFRTLSGGLPLQVPTDGTRPWGQNTLTNCWQKIADHDHTSGKGNPITTSALSNNAVDGTKFRLANNQYLRGQDSGGSDANLIKINASNLLEAGIGWTRLTTNEIYSRANAEMVINNSFGAAIGLYTSSARRLQLVGAGNQMLVDGASNIFNFTASTSDGSDTMRIGFAGGGAVAGTRGAFLRLAGNENGDAAGAAEIFGGSEGYLDFGNFSTDANRYFYNGALAWNLTEHFIPETPSASDLGSEDNPLRAVYSDAFNFTSIADWYTSDGPSPVTVTQFRYDLYPALDQNGINLHVADVLRGLILTLQDAGIFGVGEPIGP